MGTDELDPLLMEEAINLITGACHIYKHILGMTKEQARERVELIESSSVRADEATLLIFDTVWRMYSARQSA